MPFSTDDKLRNAYVNTFGNLRIGLLLEDLDSASFRRRANLFSLLL
jgi:hypothetical protein